MRANNEMFEWGRNCSTMGISEDQAQKCIDAFGDFCGDDADQFWLGFSEVPRPDGSLVSIRAMPAFLTPSSRS